MSVQQTDIDLGPLYEPAPVAFSFDQPGWYVLFAILGAVVVFGFYKWLKTYLHNAYRRQAVQLLNSIEKQFSTKQEASCVNDVLVVLKQVAITTFSRETVAALDGHKWIEFLNQHAKRLDFTSHTELIMDALYKDKLSDKDQFAAFVSIAKKWIHEHS